MSEKSGVARGLSAKARLFDLSMWTFLVISTMGIAISMLLGSGFFQALRQAQFEFAPLLEKSEVALYPEFVARVVSTWPERLSAHPVTAENVWAIVLFFCLGQFVFWIVRQRPKGIDLEACSVQNPRKTAILAQVRALSGLRGRLMMRTDDGHAALSRGRDVFIPAASCQLLDRPSVPRVAERIAFIVGHELSHARSFDNALWSTGAMLSIVVIGLLSAALSQFVAPGATILLPDAMVQALPDLATWSIVFLISVTWLALASSMVAGATASMTAAREFFADAEAAELIGADNHPYRDLEDRTKIGSLLEGWRRGAGAPDRGLHLKGVCPRGTTLAVTCFGTWFITHVAVVLLTGVSFPWILMVHDLVSIVAIGGMVVSLPRRIVGARDYGAIPLLAVIIVVAGPALFLSAIDGFAARFHLAPLIGTTRLAWIFCPALVCAVIVAFAFRASPLGSDRLSEVDRLPCRWSLRPLGWFVGGIPAWACSYTLGGLGFFTSVTTVASVLTKGFVSDTVGLINLISVFVLLPISILVALNFRRSTRSTFAGEMVVMLLVLLFGYGCAVILYTLAAIQPEDAPGLSFGFEAFVAHVRTNGWPLPPAVPMLLLFSIMSASWWARYRFKAWQMAAAE